MNTAPTTTAPRFANGVMTITMAGVAVDLRANPRTARDICRLYGGITQAAHKVNGYDIEAIVNIINSASGRSGKEAKLTEDEVFDEGLVVVGPLVSMYINFLSTGGKAPEPAKAADDGAGADEAAAPGEAI